MSEDKFVPEEATRELSITPEMLMAVWASKWKNGEGSNDQNVIHLIENKDQ